MSAKLNYFPLSVLALSIFVASTSHAAQKNGNVVVEKTDATVTTITTRPVVVNSAASVPVGVPVQQQVQASTKPNRADEIENAFGADQSNKAWPLKKYDNKSEQLIHNVTAVNSIYNIAAKKTNDNATELKIYFNGMPTTPKVAFLHEPNRLMLNFGRIDLTQKKMSINSTNEVKNVEFSTLKNGDLILVVDLGEGLNQDSKFTSKSDGGAFVLKVYPKHESSVSTVQVYQNGVNNISFERTKGGEDQAIIGLQSPTTPIDVKQNGRKVLIRFAGNPLPNNLIRTKNFNDVRAIIHSFKSYNDGKTGVVELTVNGSFSYTAIQADKNLIVSFAENDRGRLKPNYSSDQTKYTGKRISMDFQNIETRRVLQILGQYTGLNVVTSDNIKGNTSLKVQDVPSDQALNVILKTNSLAQRRDGNIIWVAPINEMVAFEENEAKADSRSMSLAPLRTEYIQLNYAMAADVQKMILATRSAADSSSGALVGSNSQLMRSQLDVNGAGSSSLLSPRGTVTIDSRTNMLIISDTAEKNREIKAAIAQVDVPVRQVVVEARIVHTSTDTSKALGVQWGFEKKNGMTVASNMSNLQTLYNNKWSSSSSNSGSLDSNVNLDLSSGVSSLGVSSIAFGLINTSNTLLGLELSALQSSGLAEVLSSPKVMTGDKQEALIRSGVKLPYSTTSGNSGTTTTFQDAVLELKVTPSITPDGNVQMKLEISKDTVGALTDAGYAIDSNKLSTNVLVGNGETVVLGGLYENSNIHSEDRVPLLSSIPVLGSLFKSKSDEVKKQELLIFITPKVINDPKDSATQ